MRSGVAPTRSPPSASWFPAGWSAAAAITGRVRYHSSGGKATAHTAGWQDGAATEDKASLAAAADGSDHRSAFRAPRGDGHRRGSEFGSQRRPGRSGGALPASERERRPSRCGVPIDGSARPVATESPRISRISESRAGRIGTDDLSDPQSSARTKLRHGPRAVAIADPPAAQEPTPAIGGRPILGGYARRLMPGNSLTNVPCPICGCERVSPVWEGDRLRAGQLRGLRPHRRREPPRRGRPAHSVLLRGRFPHSFRRRPGP